LPPETRDALRKRWQEFQSLSPEEQARVRENFRKWRKLPPERRRALRERWQRATPEQRQQMRQRQLQRQQQQQRPQR
jgi:hypothetical protein